jgi:hypothetical protein
MAYTKADLATLRAAIGSGLLRVRYADGREISYQSGADMLKAEQRIMDALASAPGAARPRRRAAGWRNGC